MTRTLGIPADQPMPPPFNAMQSGAVSAWKVAVAHINALEKQLAAMENELNTDQLTGIANRRAFTTYAQNLSGPAVVAMVDLDRFKPINDHYGHETGDVVLQVVARRLHKALSAFGLVARLGGDEFAFILGRGLPSSGVVEIASNALLLALRSVAAPLEAKGQLFTVGASIGAAITSTNKPFAMALHQADMAMYRAKATRSGVAFYTPSLDSPKAGNSAMRVRDLAVPTSLLWEVS